MRNSVLRGGGEAATAAKPQIRPVPKLYPQPSILFRTKLIIPNP